MVARSTGALGVLAGMSAVAGCGCPTFETLNVQDPGGVATAEQIDLVSRAADAFVAWTGRESVCVDTIELTNVADEDNLDAVGAYFGPNEAIRIQAGDDAWLPGVTWHELGHALDDTEQIALSYGYAFPAKDIDEHYVGAEVRIDEAFAQASQRGPPPGTLVGALLAACGEIDSQDEVLRDLVFRKYHEDSSIGRTPAGRWSLVATLGSSIYDVQPYTDPDGTSGLVGVSALAEGNGHRYTFHKIQVGWTDAGAPSVVEVGTLDVVFDTGAGDARFVRNLDGGVVVLVSQDLDDRWLASPDFEHGAWVELGLPGIVTALDGDGIASFQGEDVWWEDFGDGFGLQGSSLDGTPLPIGEFDDGEAKPPYALSAGGGLYSMVRDPQFEEYRVQEWDGATWSDPDGLPRGVFPQGGATDGSEIALATRVGARKTTRATLYKPAGGAWSVAEATCGQEITPLLVGGDWYGVPVDAGNLGLYHWEP